MQVGLSARPFRVSKLLRDGPLLRSYGFLMERGDTNATPYENSIIVISASGPDAFRRHLIRPCALSVFPMSKVCNFYHHITRVITGASCLA